ncbi:MAG: NAD(P)H-binding protein [Actinomycetota bacterium]
MRIVVFGASGKTGRLVVAQAVQRGDDVIAFVRDASKQWFPDAVTIRQGQPSDAKAVEAVLVGADAVVSALGPIAEETTTEISDATRTIAGVMERIGPRRIAIAANPRVFSDSEVTGPYANVAAEHRRDAAILRESALDWTVVAARGLTDDPATGSYLAIVDANAPGRSLTRGDFATALLDAVGKDMWIRHIVGVSNPPVEDAEETG